MGTLLFSYIVCLLKVRQKIPKGHINLSVENNLTTKTMLLVFDRNYITSFDVESYKCSWKSPYQYIRCALYKYNSWFVYHQLYKL